MNADGGFPLIPQKNYRGVLRLIVEDVGEDMHRRGDSGFNIYEIKKDKMFSDFHAKQILKFVSEYSVELIVFQCDAGKSRSAAIAQDFEYHRWGIF